MGIGASRLHLVGMADVIERSAGSCARGRGWAPPVGSLITLASGPGRGRVGYGLDGDQRGMFRARIPWVARSMLPRWRSLYVSRAGPLLCDAPGPSPAAAGA
jgi:hypothetical protein